MAVRGPRREHLIAASLTGAVVVVVGYASGIGLRPGSAAATPPLADGGHPVAPASPTEPPLPSGGPPTGVPISPLPAVPVLPPVEQQPPSPTMPGGIEVRPSPAPPSATDPVSPSPSVPPTTPIPPPPPPGSDVPSCQPGVPQQVLDVVGGLPVLGAVTTGLGVTGSNGLGAVLLGYCKAPDGSLELAMIPAPESH
ncbi:hypothetical protein ACFWY9_01540 [Amycolatopsis sp. NPDC059027]|uniref:hypothetical protein n=1 Tax=unclassified Amycolatopsis TaxID=2618356 RepID=UPI00366A886E